MTEETITQNDVRSFMEEISKRLERMELRMEEFYWDIMIQNQAPYIQSYMKSFKNINKGKSVACIACGPTVNYFKPSPDMILLGINGAIRKFDNLDYLFRHDYFYHDPSLNEECDSYKGNNCKKFYAIHSPYRLSENKADGLPIDKIPQTSLMKKNVYPFLLTAVLHNRWTLNLECEPFADIGGTPFSAMQFLIYTNPEIIYLVGHDCTCGHFYKLENDTISFDCRVQAYRNFKELVNLNYPNTRIVSVNPVRLRGIFEDVYTESYLTAHPELIMELGTNLQILETTQEKE